jgi:hypothetical protein
MNYSNNNNRVRHNNFGWRNEQILKHW